MTRLALSKSQTALDAAWDLVKGWSAAERQQLRDDVPKLGFKASIGGRSALDVAKECLALASAGLSRRGRRDPSGRDETCYLDPLHTIIASGRTPAEELLERFHGSWRGSVDPVFSEYAY